MNAKKVNIACETTWDWVSTFSPDGYALVNCGYEPANDEDMAFEVIPSGGKFGVIDQKFNVIVPVEYDYIEWSGCFNIAKCGSKYCNVSANAHWGRKCSLNENVLSSGNAWFIVEKGGEYVVVDGKGNVIIPLACGGLGVLSRECILRKGNTTLYSKGKAIPLDKVYVCASMYDERVYLIVQKSRQYAVIRDDGTFASDFKFSFEQAKRFVDMQFGGRTIIGKMV